MRSRVLLLLVGSLASLGWTLSELSADERHALRAGEILRRRSVEAGVVSERYAGQVDADAAWLFEEARNLCALARGRAIDSLRFYRPSQLAPLLSRAGPLAAHDIDGLHTLRCDEASQLDAFYTFIDFDTPMFLPHMWALVRYESSALDGGAFAIDSRIVAGSFEQMQNEIRIYPQRAQQALYLNSSRVEPGPPVPDFVLRRAPPDDEVEALRFLRATRAKVETAKDRSPVE